MNIIRKAMLNRSRAIKELKYRALRPFGNKDFKRFIVLSIARTGSNMLVQYLNTHPHIYARGEIFQKLNGRDYKEILETTFLKQPCYIMATGFKIFYYHPLDTQTVDVHALSCRTWEYRPTLDWFYRRPIDTDSCAIWTDLINMSDLHIIHLKRKNALRTLISRKLMGLGWGASIIAQRTATGNKRITFTAEELEVGFEATRAAEQKGDSVFEGHPFLTVYYEDMVRDRDITFRKITDFLDVRYVQPKTILRKQNPEKASDIVTNYEELKRAFDDTEWHSFFEE